MTETHEQQITRLTAGPRDTTVDADGTVRYTDTGRKVRRDKGLRRPHRPGCRHCDMVQLYRLERDHQLRTREVACADEDLRLVTFREWLQLYRYETEHDYPTAA